ncbi:MAG TPA: hypothetical protein VH988_20075 [Thermoanaerobaculia bacterium]|jgi:hypothetical protein|nr:hypothetical protein [Thermoanaerobaculia bacterium]
MPNGAGSPKPVQPEYQYDPQTESYQLLRFTTPACNNDFPDDPSAYDQLAALWSQNVDGFEQQAICGNPWNSLYQAQQTAYYNPLRTPIPAGSFAVDVAWISFPNRLIQYLGQNQTPPNPYNLPQEQLWALADNGELAKYPIPQNRCPQADWNGPLQPYGPYGPRGWLDEYCEISVTRDTNNKIVRIDFTCENPEYYQTLWRISPQRVAEVFEAALNAGAPADRQITVTVEDLQLLDPQTGQPVIDPQTGLPAYNPLNKWNSGPVSVRTGDPAQWSGGAMHLTATPNTLQTEIGLGAGATVQRLTGNTDPQALICCAQYGQNYRNSDPHIGQTINLAVGAGTNISLADPPGLYIQMPSFAQYALPADPKLPAGAKPEDCWQIVRGYERLTDPITNAPYPGSFILHAAFQLPQSWIDAGVSFTVGDIKIAGEPIRYGSQVLATLEIALFGRPIPPVVAAPPEACVASPPTVTQAQPIQSMYATVWNAFYGTIIHPPTPPPGGPEVLASNSSIIPPLVSAGDENLALVLVYGAPTGTNPLPQPQWPTIVWTLPDGSADAAITTTVTGFNPSIYYAPPGNTYPSNNQLLQLTVSIARNAPQGVRGVVIVPAGQVFSPAITPAPAYLVVGPKANS